MQFLHFSDIDTALQLPLHPASGNRPEGPVRKETIVTRSTKTGAPDFEAALRELESIVATLEKGDLSLDSALKHFERGIALTRRCQTALKQAELKVEMLVEKDGQTRLTPFDAKDE